MQASKTAEWRMLAMHRLLIEKTPMRDLFDKDPSRARRFSLEAAGLFLDYSKNRISEETMRLLCALAEKKGLKKAIDAMFGGKIVNLTENRPALHTALRRQDNIPIKVNNEDMMPAVRHVLEQMQEFCKKIQDGTWQGYTGKRITDVVNIGIGGSDLGPQMVTLALKPYWDQGLTPHFLSNVDGHALEALLPKLNPETTLFIICSKTFSTQETLMNAHSVRQWFLGHAKDEKAIARHFVAISTNKKAVQAFGIAPENMFVFWDWVGGRYSVWSAIGLIVALTVGFPRFKAFLQGANAMDQHFHSAPPSANMPVILGLIGLWCINFWEAKAHAILPYDERLSRFPAYLQQLEMESNGKSATIYGHFVDYSTAPVIFGEPGTNGQHAFYQKLHQGPDFIPADFIAVLKPHHDYLEHHKVLLANCFGQMEALMRGKTKEEVIQELLGEGKNQETIKALLPHRIFQGNRPSNAILLPELTPETLGALIALYEHKVYVQSVLWDINAFDQWGVELGKKLAHTIRAELGSAQPAANHDASTLQLIQKTRAVFVSQETDTIEKKEEK